MPCRIENGVFVDCTSLDTSFKLLDADLDKEESQEKAQEKQKEKGFFGKLFGKKEGGSTLGNTIQDKEKRENTVRDLLDLGALFGLTNSSTGQNPQAFEQQRMLELQRMQAMQQRTSQTTLLGMPIWAFALIIGILLLLLIVFFSKLNRN